jgi:hypothetical protein
MEDEYGRTPWLLEAATTDPTGVRVHVTVTVPAGHVWDDKAIGECAEIAQMTATRASNQISDSRLAAADKVPF